MKISHSSWYQLCALALMQLLPLHAGEELLPGVTVEKIPSDARGRFIFLYSRDPGYVYSPNPPPAISNALTAAIYEYDLEKKALRKITDSPFGFPHVSKDGSAFCVLQDFGTSRIDGAAFFYTPHDQKSWRVEVKDQPTRIVMLGDRVYFCCDPPWHYPWSKGRGGIFEYHIGCRQIRRIAMPGESPDINRFPFMHQAPDNTNALHFLFSYPSEYTGKRSHRYGYYSLEATTGQISWLGVYDLDDPGIREPKTPDGRYIFLIGVGASKGLSTPFGGHTLVSSDRDYRSTVEGGSKAKGIKLLKRFSAIPLLAGTYVTLGGLSPDGRYALVCEGDELPAKTMWGRAWTYNHYAVDVKTGQTWLMIKDRSRLKGQAVMLWGGWLSGSTRSE